MHVNSIGVIIGTYLYFDCFLQNTATATAITIATVAVVTARNTTTTAATITVTSVDGSVGWSVGGSVGGGTEAARQLLGSKESIITGQVVSTCSCVEATVM